MIVKPVDNAHFGAHLPRKQQDMKEPDKIPARPVDLQAVELALAAARPYKLEAEVVWSAMKHYEKYHKTAPETYSMEWALECALNDWDI